MELTIDRRERSATAWTGGSGKELRANAALTFAERRAYRDLLHAVQLQPELARERDDFAMTPLHWIATDRDVPLRVLQHVVLAYPEATSARNLAGLLPLHMAVRKDLPLDALKTILKFYPNAIVAKTPDGKTPVEIAQSFVSSNTSKSFLEMLEKEVRSLARLPPSSQSSDSLTNAKKDSERTWSWNDDLPSSIDGSSSQRTLEESSYDGFRPLAPTWKLNKSCHLCAAKFGYFRNRHHCRNCGESVCGRHSKNAVPLKHLGLFSPQRVCSGCYSKLQTHYTDRAIARLSPHSSSPNVLGDSIVFEDALPDDFAGSPRQGRSRSVFAVPSHTKQQYPLLSPQHFQLPPDSPLIPTRAHRSATLSPSHRTVSSSNVSTRSGVSTSTAASQSNFLTTPSAISMHLTHVQRTEEPTTVLQRQREMQYRRERLAKTQLEDTDALDPWRRYVSYEYENNQNSNNDHELQLEVQMEKLLMAKRKISDALKKSKRAAHEAQEQKDKYVEMAKAYEERGYPEPSLPSTRIELGDKDPSESPSIEQTEDSRRASGSTATVVNSTTLSEDNQEEHELEHGSPIVTCPLFDDSDDGAVYGIVPSTTPRDTVATSAALFQSDALDLALDHAATYHDLGVVLLTKGEFASAAIELQRAVDLNATNALAWYHLAKALDGKGDSEAAETAIQKSLALEGDSLPSLSLLGKLLNARGEHDEAIVVFRKALNLQCPSPRSSIDE